jgi:transposase
MVLPPNSIHRRGELSDAQWQPLQPWPFLSLAKRRIVAAYPLQSTATSQPQRPAELGTASCRRQCHPGSPTCSRGKKRQLNSESVSAVEQVQQREALGWSKGGFSTKLHLRCDGNGRPITFLLTVGERHEAVVFEALMAQGAVAGKGGGRPRLRPKRVVGDKGYSSGKIRSYLRRRGLKQFRRIATRYEKNAQNYLAMLTLASIMLWL